MLGQVETLQKTKKIRGSKVGLRFMSFVILS